MHIPERLWYNFFGKSQIQPAHEISQKKPRRGVGSPGFQLCLPSSAVTVKPLANVIRDHIRCDGHQEIIWPAHENSPPFPYIRAGRERRNYFTVSDNLCKYIIWPPCFLRTQGGLLCKNPAENFLVSFAGLRGNKSGNMACSALQAQVFAI